MDCMTALYALFVPTRGARNRGKTGRVGHRPRWIAWASYGQGLDPRRDDPRANSQCVASRVEAGAVMKVSGSIAKAETTNLPVTTNAIETKAAFRIALLILFHRDRARLVHAEHVHRRRIFGGAEARDEHAALGQLLRADGHADREQRPTGDKTTPAPDRDPGPARSPLPRRLPTCGLPVGLMPVNTL